MNEGTSSGGMDLCDLTCCSSCALMFSPELSPQVLPCLHTLCISCFTQSEEITECPVCQEKFEPNEVISNLLLAKPKENLCESDKCSGCNNSSLSGLCTASQENVCAACVVAHKTAKYTQVHHVHAVTPVARSPVMCLIHKEEAISRFCLMCEQLTCRKCPPLHPHHLLQPSHEAVSAQRNEILQMVQKVQKKTPSVQESLTKLQGRLSDLEELQARMHLDVKNTVERLCHVVLKKESKLLKEIGKACKSEKKKIEERRTILQDLKAKQDRVLTFTENVLDSQDHAVFLSCKKQIRHQLQYLLEETTFPLTTMMELYFHSNELNVKKVLKAFGCIEVREVLFAWSEPGKVPNQILTTDFQQSSPPSTAGHDSSPPATVAEVHVVNSSGGDLLLQEVKSLEETLNVNMSENSPVKSEKEETNINTLINNVEMNILQVEPAENSTQSVWTKEQAEAVEMMDLMKSQSCLVKKEDDENDRPVTKIRDDEGNLVVMDCLGRDWQPHISLCRLSIPDHPSFHPTAFCVVQRERSGGFQFDVVQEDGKSVVPRCLSHPLLVKKSNCAACRLSGNLIHCCVCQRAFHRECHLPPITLSKTAQWQCVLCQDFSPTRDADVDPELSASPCLCLYEQRKCEYLLLSLSCHKHSSVLYSPATYMTVVRGRLLGKISPPYHTPAEFVSDVWLLLNTLYNSKKMQHVEHLQRFFSKQLYSVFCPALPPALLTDPYKGEREQSHME